jgi:hypothetical protein
MAVAIAILNVSSPSYDCCSLIKFLVGDMCVEVTAEATCAVTVQAETGEEMGELAFLMNGSQQH